MINIIDSIIPISQNARPGTKRIIKWIVIHETDNTSKGAGAKNHASYLMNVAKGGTTYVSWHYTVDSKEAYHHIPDDEVAWHAGDWGKDPVNGGNAAGIGIELCVNSDGDFNKTMTNAAQLSAYLLKKYNLPISAMKQHFDFNSKNCPRTMRAQGLWQGFLNTVQNELNAINPPSVENNYKMLYSNAVIDLKKANDNLTAEKARALILEQRLTSLQGAIGEIQKILANIK